MPRILFHGKLVELDQETFLSTLNDMSSSVSWLAHAACNDHRYGSINASGSQQVKFLLRSDEFSKALLNEIGDQQLRKHFTELASLADKVAQHNARMIAWLATFYNIPSLDNPKARKTLNRKLSLERRKAVESRNGIIAWVNVSNWRKLEADFRKTITEIDGKVSQITERLRMLGLKRED